MSKKLPKILNTISILCLVVVAVVVYGWYQDHQAEEVEVEKMTYTVTEETVVKKDEAAEVIVNLTVDDLKQYRNTAVERIQEIVDIQTEYVVYWRHINMSGDEVVAGMIRLNNELNKYFPKQNMDVSWCDVGLGYGDVKWVGYALQGGDYRVPCIWLCYLENNKQLVAYARADYNGRTDTFENAIKKETMTGNSLSDYTNDAIIERAMLPVMLDQEQIPDYSMADVDFVRDFADIMKDAGILPEDYHYKVGDNMSDYFQLPTEDAETEGSAHE